MADGSVYRLAVDIRADGTSAVRAIRKVGAASEETARTVDRSTDQVERANTRQRKSFDVVAEGSHKLKSAVGTLAGTIGLGGLAFGIADVVKAGEQWQQQQAQLRNALKNTGQYSSHTLDMVRNSAESLSTHGGFAGPQEISAMNQFIRLTGSASRAIKLNQDATELARGAGIGYSQAQRMIGQILTGNTGRLQRYLGIIQPVKTAEFALSQAHGMSTFQMDAESKALGKLGPLYLKHWEILHRLTPAMLQHAQMLDKQATAQKALTILQERYGNSTQTFSKTTAGAISNLKNSFDLFGETLGKDVLPAVTAIVKWIDRNRTAVLIATAAVTALGIAFGVVSAATWAWGAATTAAGAVAGAFTAVMGGMETAVLALTYGFDALGISATVGWAAVTLGATLVIAGIVLVITHFKQFKAIVSDVVTWIRDHWGFLGVIITAPIAAIQQLVKHFPLVKRAVEKFVTAPFRDGWKIIQLTFDAIVSGVRWVVQKVGHELGKLAAPFKKIGGFFGTIGSGIGHIAGNVGGNIGGFLSHPFGMHTGGIVPHMATGGLLGGYGGGDSILAMLEPGEGVIRKESVAQMGSQAFNAINAGGSVGTPGGSPDEIYCFGTLQLMAGSRIMAEQTVHTAARRQALSGRYVSG